MRSVEITSIDQLNDPAFIEALNVRNNQADRKLPGASLTFTTETAGLVQPIKHNLGRIPGGFAVTQQNGAATFISDSTGATAGTKAWDAEYIYLQPSAAGVVVTANVY